MLSYLADPQIWASFLTLAALEIVLGIDNLVFISVVVARLPQDKRPRARRIGLIGALVMRIALLASIVWLTGLTRPLFTLFAQTVSWRDLILIAGGAFLLWKGTAEIHSEVEGDERLLFSRAAASLGAVIGQIMVLDLVFSIDSIITAIGLTDVLPVMIAAITVAIAVMIFAAEPVGTFIERHPTTKMLALSFLLLIGVALIADGLHFHIPRGYIYFAIGFSLTVETLNVLAQRRRARRRG